ncbi:MAG: hypothetical protein AB7D06_13295 [Pedobacter sp.]
MPRIGHPVHRALCDVEDLQTRLALFPVRDVETVLRVCGEAVVEAGLSADDQAVFFERRQYFRHPGIAESVVEGAVLREDEAPAFSISDMVLQSGDVAAQVLRLQEGGLRFIVTGCPGPGGNGEQQCQHDSPQAFRLRCARASFGDGRSGAPARSVPARRQQVDFNGDISRLPCRIGLGYKRVHVWMYA